MQTFAQKQNRPQKLTSSGIARRNNATLEPPHREHPVLHLQRTIGNQRVLRLLSRAAQNLTGSDSEDRRTQEADQARQPVTLSIQPKLVIGQVNDPLEREADRAADKVTQTPAPAPSDGSAPPQLSRKCDGCEAETAVQMRQTGPTTTSKPASRGAPGIVHEALRSPGQPLEASARAYFEPRFGHDFSQVRVHTNEDAARSAEAIDASAYTVGTSIVFARGLYSPGTQAGSRLLAHELAHVVQSAPNPVVVRRQPGGAAPVLATHRDGSKKLKKGVMEWLLLLTDAERTAYTEQERKEIGGDVTWATMQIRFKPDRSFEGKTVTFIQTVLVQKILPGKRATVVDSSLRFAKIDVGNKDFDPFYGAGWSSTEQKWGPEGAPEGYKNAPSGDGDGSAWLFDEPMANRGTSKTFETAAVVPATGEILGSLRWGLSEDGLIGAENGDCTDEPWFNFAAAIQRFYGPKDPERGGHYDAILDGFGANDGMLATGPFGVIVGPLQKATILTADHQNKLDAVAAQVKRSKENGAKIIVQVAGFADPTEVGPQGTSEQRAQVVKSYLVSRGVPDSMIANRHYGAAWVIYPPGVREGRNRRVQIRVISS